MRPFFLLTACLLGLLAVALGAFGAHALESSGSVSRQATWATAVDYQMFHVLAILGLGAIFRNISSPWIARAQASFILGICLFSGSLYALVLFDLPVLGAVAPVGGLCLMLGWLFAAVAAVTTYTTDDV